MNCSAKKASQGLLRWAPLLEAAGENRATRIGREVLSVPLALGLIAVALMVNALGGRAAAKQRRVRRLDVTLAAGRRAEHRLRYALWG